MGSKSTNHHHRRDKYCENNRPHGNHEKNFKINEVKSKGPYLENINLPTPSLTSGGSHCKSIDTEAKKKTATKALTPPFSNLLTPPRPTGGEGTV